MKTGSVVNLIKDKATICVVNYKTPDMIRLCLRSIRKFTDYPYELIVVDNNSADASLEYLRQLKWIRLIERTPGAGESGGYAHGVGLDIGLQHCNSEFFVSMHSDTIVKKQGWLGELIRYFADEEKVACVGSGKIESTPAWRVLLKKMTDLRALQRLLFGDAESTKKYRYFNRTICCVYRTQVLQDEGLSFVMGRGTGLTTGQKLYFELIERGYRTVELSAAAMGQYIVHLAHATQAANIKEFVLPKRTLRKYGKSLDTFMSSPLVQDVLLDSSLDK